MSCDTRIQVCFLLQSISELTGPLIATPTSSTMNTDLCTLPKQEALALTRCVSTYIFCYDRRQSCPSFRGREARSFIASTIAFCCVCQFMTASRQSTFLSPFWRFQRGCSGALREAPLTCEISGFVLNIMAIVPLYNLGLSIYYVLVIRYGKSEAYIERFVEPLTRVLAISLPIGFGTC